MRIAFLTEHYAPKVDGVVTRLQHTLHHLKKKNIEIIVLTGNNHVKKFEKRENDIHVIRLPSFSYPFYKEKKLALPTKKIEKILIEFKPHVIHVVNPSLLGVMGLKIGKKYQIPTLASQHSNYTAYLDYFHLKIFKNFSSQILVKFLNKADKVLCTSTSMHELLKKDGVQNIEVWLPGVATDEITPSLRNFEIKKTNEFLLIYVGRLAKENK